MFKITYPMETEPFIRAVIAESGEARDAATVNLAVTITTVINKAYYRGKFGRGHAPALADNLEGVHRRMERGEIAPQDVEFYISVYRNEAEAFKAGRRIFDASREARTRK